MTWVRHPTENGSIVGDNQFNNQDASQKPNRNTTISNFSLSLMISTCCMTFWKPRLSWNQKSVSRPWDHNATTSHVPERSVRHRDHPITDSDHLEIHACCIGWIWAMLKEKDWAKPKQDTTAQRGSDTTTGPRWRAFGLMNWGAALLCLLATDFL